MLSRMNAVSMPNRSDEPRSNGGLLGALITLLLRGTGMLLLAVLVLLEPVVQAMLCATALLAFGTALFFRFIVGDAEFPFLGMLALSVLCILLLALYYRLVRLLCCFD
jgi:hypothetical protein